MVCIGNTTYSCMSSNLKKAMAKKVYYANK